MTPTLIFLAALIAPAGDGGSVWDRVAECESGGNWASSSGPYEGGLQFANSTWLANGGGRYAAHAYDASREAQIAVAERVYDIVGWGAWPGCADQLGLGTDPDGYGGVQAAPSDDPEAGPAEGGLPVTR